MDRVLMIDDDVELCEMMAEYLGPEGFSLAFAHDGVSGLEQAGGGHYHLVLLDVMLPELNGFEVLRRLRASEPYGRQLPVLMLTARGQAVDRIVGLEVGADDYLAKPFDERELVARMRAILRRSRLGPLPEAAAAMAANNGVTSPPANAPTALAEASAPTRQVVTMGDLSLDCGARSAWLGGARLELTAVEFDLLVMLLESAGKVVTRERITRQVLDRKLVSFDRSVDTHVSRVRRKLGPHPGGDERIKTVRGIGYIYALPGLAPGTTPGTAPGVAPGPGNASPHA